MPDFDDVELARTGTFQAVTGKVTFTESDFDEMARASKELQGQIDFPLKLGHDEHQKLLQEDGLPAAGWIENVRRIADRLVADFKRVPDKIAGLIASGGLRKRSIEAIRNGEFLGRRWPMVLTGVALLGEDLPAVDSLDDIAKLYAATGLELPTKSEGAEVLILAIQQDDVESIIKDLESLVGRAEGVIRNRKGAPQLRALVRTAVSELRRVGKVSGMLNKEGEDMDIKLLAEMLGLASDATEEMVTAALTALKSKPEELEAKLKELESKLEAALEASKGTKKEEESEAAKLRLRVIDLETEGATAKASALVDTAIKAGKFVPAVRDQLVKIAVSDPEEFATMAKNTPDNAVFAAGAKGTASEDSFELTVYEPTAEELILAKQTGLSREEVILQKMADAGVEPPANVLAALEGKSKKD
tara:strand:+ start:8639 stop:9892 length:1254 start_codon:yes stop_codon:yes gene_type:complete